MPISSTQKEGFQFDLLRSTNLVCCTSCFHMVLCLVKVLSPNHTTQLMARLYKTVVFCPCIWVLGRGGRILSSILQIISRVLFSNVKKDSFVRTNTLFSYLYTLFF